MSTSPLISGDYSCDPRLVELLYTSDPYALSTQLSDDQIRLLLPSLTWLAMQKIPKSHRILQSAYLVKIINRFNQTDDVIQLLDCNFQAISHESKKLQRARLKSNNPSSIDTSEFGQATVQERCLIVTSLLLVSSSGTKTTKCPYCKTNQQQEQQLFDDQTYMEYLGDLMCILLLELSSLFKFETFVPQLLHSKYGYYYLFRLLLNIPSISLTLIETVVRTSSSLCGTAATEIDHARYQLVLTYVKLYPNYKNRILRLCFQRKTLLLILLELFDESTVNILTSVLTDIKHRHWFNKYMKQHNHQELIRTLLTKLFTFYKKQTNLAPTILKICGILHIHCDVKFTQSELSQLLMILTSMSNITLALSFLMIVPTLIESVEQTVIQWLKHSLEKDVSEKLLMIGIFCSANYLEPLNAIVSNTLGFNCVIRPGTFTHLRNLLTQTVFTTDILIQRFPLIPVTKNLSTSKQSSHAFLPAHFICHLLSSGSCNLHHVNMNKWIYDQILLCVEPVHPIMLTLINEYVRACLRQDYPWHLDPIYSKDIEDFFNDNPKITLITTKTLLLLYLLSYDEQVLKIIPTSTNIQRYPRKLFDLIPMPYLAIKLTDENYSSIAPQLGRLMMEQFPYVFLADHVLYLEADRFHPQDDQLLLDVLANTLENGISRKQAEQWRRLWFRAYAVSGQQLTLKTARVLLKNSSLTYDSLCSDPNCLLRFPHSLYNYSPIIQIILFIMRELLIASRYQFDRFINLKQQQQSADLIRINDLKPEQLKESLIHAQEGLVIQILLDALDEYDKIASSAACRELQGVICSFIHQMFISNPVLAKLVHLQGYESQLIKPMIYSVPSAHICLDFIPQMLSSNDLNKQIFAFELITELAQFYPIKRALLVTKLSLQVYATLLRVLPFESRIRFFCRTYRFLTNLSSIFPPLTQYSIFVLQQAARACSLPPSSLPKLTWSSDDLSSPRNIGV